MKRKILITGGEGMIGQAIAKGLDPKEWEVWVYDNRSNRFIDYTKKGMVGYSEPMFFGQYAFEEFDVISHQAASVSVGESMYRPRKYAENNVLFTAELIQRLIDSNWKGLFMHAGSMGPYEDTQMRHEEDSSIHPSSFYGVTKHAQEELLRVYAEAYDVPVISLRYFSVYSTDIDMINNPYTGILNIIANQAIKNDVVELYDDGTQTRDMIHVDDVAEIHNNFVNRFFGTKKFEKFNAFNVATGTSFYLKWIAERMLQELGIDKPIVFNGKIRAGDIHDSRADITKLRKTGLCPAEFIALEDSIKEYCAKIKAAGLDFVEDTVKRENQNIMEKGLVK